ncbi:unnamed protein product [Kuraishia capsulata CBS 1993]|uniref:Sterol-4-alpha-carboxylate 3-dehydrogenase ERG26, decarboxylating n=1 Tax=Kuraishia capsulata CBS 1993 TaxID=1382522 RepID=W6MPR1_9ASCO|nr:uncharacterized protein KUCA_T00004615001 [Kuraishia capsulata CBS 1993]CDK28631.1 unnamed protein product [Kuraishia capsulata CBS 1993]
MDSVLLIGGAGFLGLHLIEQFSKLDPQPKINVFDIRPLPDKLATYFSFDPSSIGQYTGDLTSEDDLKRVFEITKPDVVVHSASPIHGMAQAIYEKVNVEGTKTILKVCQDLKIKALVYTSSAGVIFNGEDIHNADETWPIPEVPLDGYNDTKARAETMVLGANNFTGLKTVALRPAGIFGPGDRQLVPGLRQVAKLGQSKFQIGDNNNLFDWTYAGNVADAHILAAQKLLSPDPEVVKAVGGQTFFVTNDAPTYFWTLARTVWKSDGHIDNYNIVLSRPVAILAGYLSQFFSKLANKEPGLTPFRVKIVCAFRYHNIAKAKRLLGYKPQVGLEEGIQKTLEWMDETKQ